MDIYISYVVKLPNKPIVYVYRVANEDEAKRLRLHILIMNNYRM